MQCALGINRGRSRWYRTPCFFHEPIGNIRHESLDKILNSEKAIEFRKGLDVDTNDTCIKCVCYLNLSPAKNVGK